MLLKTLLVAFASAWQMLLEWPLPAKLENLDAAESEEKTVSLMTLSAFPVIGLLMGVVILLAGTILSLAAPISGAIVFAMLATILVEIRDFGHASGALASFAALKVEGRPTVEALFNIDYDLKNLTGAVSVAVLVLVILFKFFCFFLMSYFGFCYWAVAVFVLGYVVQGDLALLPAVRTGEPFIEVHEGRRFIAWGLAAFFLLFVMFQAPYLTLAFSGIVFVGSVLFRKYCEHSLGGVSSSIISLAGYMVELAALLAGIIFIP
jgi:cobalamin synthase